MAQEWNTLATLALQLVGGLCFVLGGLRFRSWAVEDRAGIPRFPSHVETVLLWLVYSVSIAIVIIVFKQTLRHL
jgi:hypothetical protein